MSVPRYWREIPQRYRLEAAKCSRCGKVYFPPRLICGECKSRSLQRVQLKDEGKLLTYTVIHVPLSPFADQVPYIMGIVQLDDGVNITAQIADCEPEEVQIGMRVRVEFRKIQEVGKAGIIQYGYKCVKQS